MQILFSTSRRNASKFFHVVKAGIKMCIRDAASGRERGRGAS